MVRGQSSGRRGRESAGTCAEQLHSFQTEHSAAAQQQTYMYVTNGLGAQLQCRTQYWLQYLLYTEQGPRRVHSEGEGEVGHQLLNMLAYVSCQGHLPDRGRLHGHVPLRAGRSSPPAEWLPCCVWTVADVRTCPPPQQRETPAHPHMIAQSSHVSMETQLHVQYIV